MCIPSIKVIDLLVPEKDICKGLYGVNKHFESGTLISGWGVRGFTIYPGRVDVQLLVKSVLGVQIRNIGTHLN